MERNYNAIIEWLTRGIVSALQPRRVEYLKIRIMDLRILLPLVGKYHPTIAECDEKNYPSVQFSIQSTGNRISKIISARISEFSSTSVRAVAEIEYLLEILASARFPLPVGKPRNTT